MQDNRIPRPMTEAEILRRRELRRAAIKKQKRRRTLFLTACGLAAVLLITGIVLLCRGAAAPRADLITRASTAALQCPTETASIPSVRTAAESCGWSGGLPRSWTYGA